MKKKILSLVFISLFGSCNVVNAMNISDMPNWLQDPNYNNARWAVAIGAASFSVLSVLSGFLTIASQLGVNKVSKKVSTLEKKMLEASVSSTFHF